MGCGCTMIGLKVRVTIVIAANIVIIIITVIITITDNHNHDWQPSLSSSPPSFDLHDDDRSPTWAVLKMRANTPTLMTLRTIECRQTRRAVGSGRQRKRSRRRPRTALPKGATVLPSEFEF